jgi:O-antigen/teichoic acid export membrane protein
MNIKFKSSHYKKYLQSKSGMAAIIYVASNFFNAALPFLLLPILTSKLSPSEYGLTSMVMVLVTFVYPIITFGIFGAISRAYHRDEVDNFSKYVGNCLFIALTGFVFVNFVFLFSEDLIVKYTKIPTYWYFSCLVIALENFIIDLNLLTYRLKFKAKQYAQNKMSQTIFSFILTYIFVVNLEYGWKGVIIAKLIVLTIYSFYSLYLLIKNKNIEFKINKTYIRNALLFGIPLVPHLMAGFVINVSDRVFITNIMDVSKTGSYAVAYQIGSVIDLVSNSINLAWVPWLFSNLKNFEKNKNKIRKTTILGILGIVSIAVIFILLLPFIVKLFVSKEFEISFPVIILVVIGLVFQGCYLLFVNYLFYNGRTKIVSIITFSIAGINIIMNYFMITTYGILGGAIATALCFFLKFLIIFLVSNKLYKIF